MQYNNSGGEEAKKQWKIVCVKKFATEKYLNFCFFGCF